MDWIVCLNVATLATEDGVKMNVTVIKKNSAIHRLDVKLC